MRGQRTTGRIPMNNYHDGQSGQSFHLLGVRPIRGQRERGKIQRTNYHHGNNSLSLRGW